MVEDLPNIIFLKGISKGYLIGKHLDHKFEKRKEKITSYHIHIIHGDIAGPIPHLFLNNSRYILTFIDDYSRYSRVYFQKLKSEVFESFKFFKADVENFTRNKIKVLHTDNGGEYVNI